jgi:hypothetical protein
VHSFLFLGSIITQFIYKVTVGTNEYQWRTLRCFSSALTYLILIGHHLILYLFHAESFKINILKILLVFDMIWLLAHGASFINLQAPLPIVTKSKREDHQKIK